MALTLESVCKELGSSTRMDDVCEAVAHGSLMGARGNSGVILSQILRGLADTFRDLDAIDERDLTAALRTAADAAYQAVMRPVEGTILTVVRATAEAAEAAGAPGEATLRGLLEAWRAAARDASARPPTCCRCSRRRAWSTPAVTASRFSSTRSSPWSTAGRCPSHRWSRRPRPSPRTGTATRSRRSATRSCSCSTPTTRRFPRSRTRGARSATRSSSSGATVSGTATCTRTTSARRSRPASRPADRRRSASPTSPSRSRRSSGCGPSTADGTGPATARPPSPRRQQSSRSRSAKGSSACCAASVSRSSSPAGSR